MEEARRKKFTDAVREFISVVSINLSDDVDGRLRELIHFEERPGASVFYQNILKNLHLAETEQRPLCQDTGVLQFFVSVGTGFPYMDEIKSVLTEATERATAEIPLRPNAVEPLGEHNTGTNTGYGAPYIEYDLVPGSSDLRIRMYMAGGGSSLPGRSKVLMPLEGVDGVKRFVYDTIAEWGPDACPPLIVGIGLGTCAATSAALSKKALLRPVGTHSEYPEIAGLEQEIRTGLDLLGIAPLGFGGSYSVLGVNIEAAAHHPATLGVGITVGCWATRKGDMTIHEDLSYEISSHKRLAAGRTV